MNLPAMRPAYIDGVQLDVYDSGAGEPVVFVHGGMGEECFAVLAEPALTERYRLIHYHRRGWGNSSKHGLPLSIPQQAEDCRAVMQHLGIDRAHLAGLSYGGAILVQFAVDFPEATQTLTLMEPSLPSMNTAPPEFQEAVTKAMSLREAGETAAALDTVFQVVCGPDYAAVFDQELPPGWFERWVEDAETLFQHDVPAIGNWQFTAEDAARIAAPVLTSRAANTYDHERNEAVQLWFPHAERAVVPNATHCMLLANPAGAADILVRFISRHPLAT